MKVEINDSEEIVPKVHPIGNNQDVEIRESITRDTASCEWAAIDFETTYSKKVSLEKMSVDEYLVHPDVKIYQVALASSEGFTYVGSQEEAPWEILIGKTWVAHNVGFDSKVFDKLQREGVIPSSIIPEEWIDTADMVRYWGAPRNLKGASLALLDRDLDKGYRETAEGRDPESFTLDEWEDIKSAGLADAQAALDLALAYYKKWPITERKLSALGRELYGKGVRIDVKETERQQEILAEAKKVTDSEMPWVAKGMKPKSPKAFKAYCEEYGLACPKSLSKKNQMFLHLLATHGESHPALRAFQKRGELNTLKSKVDRLLKSVREDGTVPVDTVYFGGHTGRASSRGVNVQNFPNGEIHGVNLRKLIIPDPGCVFVGVDYCQIEPRVIAWCLGDEEMLSSAQAGISIYEAYARKYIGWSGGNLKQEDKTLYSLVKITVLSLYYGTGAVRFREAVEGQGIEMSEAEAYREVKRFRNSQTELRKTCKEFEKQFADSAGLQTPYQIPLPSGRALRYFDVSYDFQQGQMMASTTEGAKRDSFWGAKLFENMIQAIARDIFIHHLIQLVDAGLDIRLHVHDEIIVQCKIEDAEWVRELMTLVMETTPRFAHGVPLTVESEIMNFFK